MNGAERAVVGIVKRILLAVLTAGIGFLFLVVSYLAGYSESSSEFLIYVFMLATPASLFLPEIVKWLNSDIESGKQFVSNLKTQLSVRDEKRKIADSKLIAIDALNPLAGLYTGFIILALFLRNSSFEGDTYGISQYAVLALCEIIFGALFSYKIIFLLACASRLFFVGVLMLRTSGDAEARLFDGKTLRLLKWILWGIFGLSGLTFFLGQLPAPIALIVRPFFGASWASSIISSGASMLFPSAAIASPWFSGLPLLVWYFWTKKWANFLDNKIKKIPAA